MIRPFARAVLFAASLVPVLGCGDDSAVEAGDDPTEATAVAGEEPVPGSQTGGEGPVYWPLPDGGPGPAWFLLDHLEEAQVDSPLLQRDLFQMEARARDLALLTASGDWTPPDAESPRAMQFRQLPVPAWFQSPGVVQALRVTDPAGEEQAVWLMPAAREFLLSDRLEPVEPPMPTRRDPTGTRSVLVEQDCDLVLPVDLFGQAAKATLKLAKGPGVKDRFPDGVEEGPTVEVLLGDVVLAGPLRAPEGKVNFETTFDVPAGDHARLGIRIRGAFPGFGSTTLLLKSLDVALPGRKDLLVAPAELDPETLISYLVETGDGIQALPPAGRDLVLAPGTVSVHAQEAQPFQVRWNGAVVASAESPTQDLSFEPEALEPGRLEVVGPNGGRTRGPFWVLQPRLMLRRLTMSDHGADAESPVRDDVDLLRGSESVAGDYPLRDHLVRHRMVADESRRCLLATPGTRIEAPWEARPGDRLELSLSAWDLSDADQPRAAVSVRVAWRDDGPAGEETVLIQEPVVVGLKSWQGFSVPLPEGAGAGRLILAVTGSAATPPGVAPRLCPLLAEPVLLRAPDAERPAPPNVLIYLIDTLRADHVSAYGYERTTTPAIDRLAAEGVLFERAYSQAPWTRPSVATLFSGFYYGFHNAGKVTGLAPGLNTLGECMRAAGFATGAFIANAHVHGESLNFEQGFSEFVGVERKRGDSRANDVNDVVFEWLDRHQDRPFFLYVHTIDPHATYDPPEATAGTYNKDYDGDLEPKDTHAGSLGKREGISERDVQYLLDLYDEEILFNDRHFGELVKKLKQLGLYENTLILVTSDHGEEFREHGEFGHGKRLWEELIHVPFVVKPPASAQVPGGQRIAEPVGLIDVLDTTTSFAGITLPGPTQGVDLKPWTLGALPAEPRVLLSEEEADDVMAHRAMIRGNIKLIEWYGNRRDEPVSEENARKRYRLQLFDLARDPHERHDLAEQDPEQARRVRQLMESVLRDLSERFPTFRGDLQHLSPGEYAALKALGYIN